MQWLPINEYSAIKKISISTIRRYIKKDKVRWKKIDGKYLIEISNFDNLTNMNSQKSMMTIHFMQSEIDRLNRELQEVKEECSEYKMLVNLYENMNQVNENENKEKYIH